jgi:CRISPR-associated protein Cmr2
VSKVFWQAKIWGLLHDPIFKALHDNSGRGKNSLWQQLAVMQDWVTHGLNPEESGGKAMKQMKLADLITSASDRGAIGSLSVSVDYAGTDDRDFGLQISHLLSGAKTDFKLQSKQHQQLISGSRQQILSDLETALFNLQIKDKNGELRSISEIDDPQKLFWWLWRCLPTAACNLMGDDRNLLLMPAETRIPDGSIWNHTSLTAAMAGALTGFDLTLDDLQKWTRNQEPSHAYLATFSFTPIQELIKASRKMRDFWAGSWLLHYLSAKVSWELALKYGPDSLVYPSLFQQPLIDDLLLDKWSDFAPWIDRPSERQLLTAGFPNVIVMLVPEGKVDAAMQYAKQVLEAEWLKIGDLVFGELQERKHPWMPELVKEHITWNGWLQTQWQTYWSAMPVGDRTQPLTSSEIHRNTEAAPWRDRQNQTFQVSKNQQLFREKEAAFINQAASLRRERYGKHPFNANVGSWWPHIFDRTRANVTAVKNARTWKLPTAFDTRSTISGLGSIVHHYPVRHKVTDTEAKALWQNHAGCFDGREQLNATEVVKRVLHKVIPKLIPSLTDADKIDAIYPDLTAGVAGYLRTQPTHQQNFRLACNAVEQELRINNVEAKNLPKNCGIPWMESQLTFAAKKYHPRHLSPGWLVEEIEIGDDQRKDLKTNLDRVVTKYYPGNNPADWYVLAAGDGDDLSKWLKGNNLKQYRDYIPDKLFDKVQAATSDRASTPLSPRADSELSRAKTHNPNQPRGLSGAEARTPQSIESDSLLFTAFNEFLDEQKRMGPSTHAALSRALLDFSNQLVPYLTEQRYAGRLVYSGGDDVLAYTNLWEWDRWLWDVRECFRGKPDPVNQFGNEGDYWQWQDPNNLPKHLAKRPLFTMGKAATISFGIVIANQDVPLAIALENMWDAEQKAKEHFCETLGKEQSQKNAVQVRVLYGNGNILKATAKFEAFDLWRRLLDLRLEPAMFEQAAQVWAQHPVPSDMAILAWTNAFSDRRDAFSNDGCLRLNSTPLTASRSDNSSDKDLDLNNRGLSGAEDRRDIKQEFITTLSNWLTEMWNTNNKSTRDDEIGYWLKLAAFVLRKRNITIPAGGDR